MRNTIIFILVLLSSVYCYADTHDTDTTPTVAEVQTLITNSNDGDTIRFAGGATWSETVTVNKPITLDGNGHTLTSSGALTNGFFSITGYENLTTPARITGFTFVMDINAVRGIYTFPSAGYILVRIDHNTFHHGQSQIEAAGVKGVIDNNYFYNSLNVSCGHGAGSRTLADSDWADLSMGTDNALFIESNHFITDANYLGNTYSPRIDTQNGGKLVVRYNSFDASASPEGIGVTSYFFQAHGNASGYWQNANNAFRGQSTIEIYNNTLAARRLDLPIALRGSAAVIHHNTIIGAVQNAPRIYFYEEEEWLTSQFSPSRTEWPAEDQVNNTFIWNNTYNENPWGGVITDIALGDDGFIMLDRDIFLHAPCGGSAETDSYGNDCTHGRARYVTEDDCTGNTTPYICCTGNGTGDCRNGASETAPTDGTTFANYGTMIFTAAGDNAYLGYTPYTYPHPLRGESPATTISTSNSTITSDSLTVTGTSTDAVGVSGCKFRIGSAPDASNGTACTGTTSFSCATTGFASGSNTLYVGCYDAAGNYGSDSIIVTFTPPTASGCSFSGGVMVR